MTRQAHILCALRRDDKGSALVELAVAIPLLLVFVFAILEYGRLFWIESTLQKAMQVAARTAAVRTPVCPGVPTTVQAIATGPGETPARFGTLCRSGAVCADPGDQTCLLNTGVAVGAEIWDRVENLMPPGATAANVQLTYSFDPRLGFLGGPYSPVVTAELVNLDFEFVLPIGALVAMAANDPAIAAASPTRITLPSMSTSLPGEDLAVGLPN